MWGMSSRERNKISSVNSGQWFTLNSTGSNEKKFLPTHGLPISTCEISCLPSENLKMTENMHITKYSSVHVLGHVLDSLGE